MGKEKPESKDIANNAGPSGMKITVFKSWAHRIKAGEQASSARRRGRCPPSRGCYPFPINIDLHWYEANQIN